MALSIISKFDWDKILAKVDTADAKRTLNMLRAKSNEIMTTAGKFGQAPEKIDFSAYKSKLKFTARAVDELQDVYKKRTLPNFHATLPSFEAKKREMMLSVINRIAEAAKEDLKILEEQLVELEKTKVTKETTYGDMTSRFPNVAREIEQEIKNHEWSK